ncbi:MAG: DMT family transporter [Mycobacteriales bacterium]
MSLALAVPLAVASAGFLAVGTAVQQREAARHSAASDNLLMLIRALARRPGWLFANLALLAGVALHGAALSAGTLVIVQPLLLTGLLFTMPLSARLHRRRVTAVQWCWAAVTVTGLGAFLLLAGSGAGRSRPDLDAHRAGVVVAGIAVTAMGLTAAAAARWRGPRAKAALYGVSSGTAAGLAAAGLKATAGLLPDPHLRVLASPYPYLTVALGAVAFVLAQAAYRSGPLPASVPALTLSDPVVSIAVGLGLFAEHLRGGLGVRTLEVTALLVTFAAVVGLARAEDAPAAGAA